MARTADQVAPLAVVRTLTDEISARAQEIEDHRTLPRDLVATLRDAQLFKLALPRALGGLECDPLTIVDVIEAVSAADPSTGWTTMIANGTGMFAWIDPAVAKPIFDADPDLCLAGTFAPIGKGVPQPDGTIRLTGRWPFNSGCPHSQWLIGGMFVMDGEAPRMLDGGRPDWRFAFFPAGDAEIIDTWRVAGLRGTGSHDVAVNDVVVPEELTCSPFFEPARHDGPLYRLSFFNYLGVMMAGVPLGIARRALDEFATLAQRKSRSRGAPLAVDPVVNLKVAEAEASLRAARAFVREAFADIWTTVTAGDQPTVRQRINVVLATVQACRAGTEAADTVFKLAGGGALYDTSPIQRCWRDLHAAGQHIYMGAENWKNLGLALHDQEFDTWRI